MATLQHLVSALAQLGVDHANEAAFSTVVDFCATRWDIPVVVTSLYLAMVFATRTSISKHSHTRAVERAFAAWNLGLSLFSCWGFVTLSRGLRMAFESEGLFFTVCAETRSILRFSEGTPSALALALFCLSKIPELGDTVFLILKRKPVRLLQWYHHASVLLFCWLALATQYTPGVWFAVTNFLVHSVMYLYFFLMTFKGAAKVVRPIAPLVTMIQIVQMVWGLVVNGIAVGSFFRSGSCQIQAVTAYAAVAMYASYFYLFAQMFIEARRAAGKAGGSVTRTLSRKLSQALLEDSDDGAANGSKKLN